MLGTRWRTLNNTRFTSSINSVTNVVCGESEIRIIWQRTSNLVQQLQRTISTLCTAVFLFLLYRAIVNNGPPFYIGTPDILATFGRKSSKLMAPQKKYDFQKNSENSGTPWPPSAAGKFGHFGACFC